MTGKKANNGYVVTFSHKRNKKLQHINLQEKKVYWPEGSRWVKLRVCTKVSRPQATSAPLVLAAAYHIQEQELFACWSDQQELHLCAGTQDHREEGFKCHGP